MGRMDWSQLSVTEEWTAVDPSDLSAVSAEQERIQELSSLILKAFSRHRLAKAKRVKQMAMDTDQLVEG